MYDLSQVTNEGITAKEKICRDTIRTYQKDILKFFNKYMGLNPPDSKPELFFKKQEDNLFNLLNEEFDDINFDEIESLKTIKSKLLESETSILNFNVKNNIENLEKSIDNHFSDVQFRLDKLKKRLFDLNRNENDAFGSYEFYNERAIRININFLTCIFFCNEYELDLSKFVLSTYVHELSHYYNHLGKDKDDSIWLFFKEVDSELKEGLAQYYTYEYFKNKGWEYLIDKESTMKDKNNDFVFNAVYREYIKYRKYSKEQVYSAMIYTRRNNVKNHFEFINILDDYFKKLPR